VLDVERCRRGALALLITWVMLATGCAGLPEQTARVHSTHLAASASTPLGRAVAAQQEGVGLSGLRALSDPLDAFAARILLSQRAERSLDVQYYIWRPDTTGTLMLSALKEAADRGVKVRLLLDDNGTSGMDALLSSLDKHPHIEVRLFNPFPMRRLKPLSYLLDFQRVNRRMHNKAMIVDASVAIVGGRNIGDAYFAADDTLEFADLDVLTAGPVVGDMSRSFDAYWNSALAYPLAAIIQAPAEEARTAHAPLKERLSTIQGSEAAQRYQAAVHGTHVARDFTLGLPALQWVPMQLLADPPEKAEGRAPQSQWMATSLHQAMGHAEHSLDLISPYFVPGALGTDLLTAYPARGVHLRVVTNSLAATDVVAVHPGYARRRLALLQKGVQLFETKADEVAPPTRPWRLPGSSSASLHGKAFVMDGRRTFVGSFNIDPRSVVLNTEMGVVIDSPELARSLSQGLDASLPHHAYQVRLGPTGRLEWVEHTSTGPIIHHQEPGAGWWRRSLAWLLSWLPIESLL